MSHQSFVDWMKAIGMLLVIIGHIVGDPLNPFNQATQPIYTKQLGVAFFIFVMGWSLANDSGSRWRVVFNRLFPVYFYGIACALLVSFIFYFYKGDLNESNYLPFFFGANILLNYFPANPSTWYIGTYFHVLLFWCFFLHGRRIGLGHIALGFVCENVVRCALLSQGQDFIAYMSLPNWLSVFLLGYYFYQQRDCAFSSKSVVLALLWFVGLAAWVLSSSYFTFGSQFPFRSLPLSGPLALPAQSVLISFVYIVNTLCCFQLVRALPAWRPVAFFARNTLIIFIAHMPIVFELSGYVYAAFDARWMGQALAIVVLFVGLAWVSELIQTQVPLRVMRNKLWSVIEPLLARLGLIK